MMMNISKDIDGEYHGISIGRSGWLMLRGCRGIVNSSIQGVENARYRIDDLRTLAWDNVGSRTVQHARVYEEVRSRVRGL